MTTTRQAVIDRLNRIRGDVDDAVQRAPTGAWYHRAYDDGWTAREVLAHVASMTSVVSFVLAMAKASSGETGGAAFDQDAFNAQQVGMRAGKSLAEVADEVRANILRETQAMERADQALLDKHFVAAWGSEGTVAKVIRDSLNDHVGTHISDMRRALEL